MKILILFIPVLLLAITILTLCFKAINKREKEDAEFFNTATDDEFIYYGDEVFTRQEWETMLNEAKK